MTEGIFLAYGFLIYFPIFFIGGFLFLTPCTSHCTVKAIITMGRFLYLYFDNSLTLFCSVFPSPSVFVFLEIFQTPLSRSFRNSVLAVNWWFGLSSTIANRNSCSSGSFFFIACVHICGNCLLQNWYLTETYPN